MRCASIPSDVPLTILKFTYQKQVSLKCMSAVKVLEGYRVTIPQVVRTRLRIKKGDRLLCQLRGRDIVLRVEHIPEAPTLKMVGLATRVEATLEQAVLEEMQEKLARHAKVSGR